jgi:hypothetical protein
MAWRQIFFKTRVLSLSQQPHPTPGFSRFFSKSSLYVGKVFLRV